MKLTDIDKIVCLAVDKRQEHWPRVQQLVESRGAKLQLFKVGDGKLLPREEYSHIDSLSVPTYFAGHPNSYKAFLSFQRIIRQAYADNTDSLLLLEDDVDFTPEFDEVLDKIDIQILERGLKPDMLYLGCNHSWSLTKEISDNIIRTYGGLCWHAVLLRRSIFPAIMSLTPTFPIDGLVAKMLHPEYQCYAVWPNIAVQLPGFSNVEGRDRDYSEFWSSKGKIVT